MELVNETDSSLVPLSLAGGAAPRSQPVLENGMVVNVVSERDLFAIQRLSLKQVSSAARGRRCGGIRVRRAKHPNVCAYADSTDQDNGLIFVSDKPEQERTK